MKLLFFFTSFSQLKQNKLQSKFWAQQLNNNNIDNFEIDIIVHNNNKDYFKK